jgi:hypothetical protein
VAAPHPIVPSTRPTATHTHTAATHTHTAATHITYFTVLLSLDAYFYTRAFLRAFMIDMDDSFFSFWCVAQETFGYTMTACGIHHWEYQQWFAWRSNLHMLEIVPP